MMFGKEDFQWEMNEDFVSFLLVIPFLILVGPFLCAAYTLGFLQDVSGWLDT